MLNKEEFKQIRLIINNWSLERAVEEELLDHYACIIEQKMLRGFSFNRAMEEAFKDLSKKEAQHISQQRKKQQLFLIMKTTAPIIILLSFIAFIMFSNMQERSEPWQLPVKLEANINMVSGFGYRLHPIYKTRKLHRGMDISAPVGTPVYPVKSGVVISCKESTRGYGNHIKILHPDSSTSLYAQLHEIRVEQGAIVTQKDTIGTVGSSGTSTAPHLHFEIMQNGSAVNPSKVDSVFLFR